jgi:hypothetical protein
LCSFFNPRFRHQAALACLRTSSDDCGVQGVGWKNDFTVVQPCESKGVDVVHVGRRILAKVNQAGLIAEAGEGSVAFAARSCPWKSAPEQWEWDSVEIVQQQIEQTLCQDILALGQLDYEPMKNGGN